MSVEADIRTAGGYSKFVSEGWDDKYLPVWLQAAGYNTYFTGKLMDGLSVSNWKDPYANEWTASNCESPETPDTLT